MKHPLPINPSSARELSKNLPKPAKTCHFALQNGYDRYNRIQSCSLVGVPASPAENREQASEKTRARLAAECLAP
jgi:hypothetical protein